MLVSVFSTVCVEGWKTVKVTKAGIEMEYMLPWLVSRRFNPLPRGAADTGGGEGGGKGAADAVGGEGGGEADRNGAAVTVGGTLEEMHTEEIDKQAHPHAVALVALVAFTYKATMQLTF